MSISGIIFQVNDHDSVMPLQQVIETFNVCLSYKAFSLLSHSCQLLCQLKHHFLLAIIIIIVTFRRTAFEIF